MGIRKYILATVIFAGTSAFATTETRNGWYVNETPGDMTLMDKDGEWIIGIQGGYQAEWRGRPELTSNEDEFVASNPPHGYSCVSLRVEVNPQTKQVLRVLGGRQLLLKNCLEDGALPNPPR